MKVSSPPADVQENALYKMYVSPDAVVGDTRWPELGQKHSLGFPISFLLLRHRFSLIRKSFVFSLKPLMTNFSGFLD